MFKWLYRKKWLLLTFLIIGGAIASVVFFATRPKPPEVPETTTVHRAKLVQSVEATGSVKPGREFSLDFDQPGRVSAVRVQIGDHVKAGDVLAEIDATSLDLQVARAKAGYNMALANLAQRQAGEIPESIKLADAELRRAEASLAESQLRLDATRRTSELSIRMAEVGVELKQLGLDDARSAPNPEGSNSAIRMAELSLTQSQYELQNARLNSQTGVNSQEAAVAVAAAGRDSARAGLDAKRAHLRAVDRAPLDASIAEAKASLSLAETSRAEAALHAPVEGVITDVAVSEGESSSPRTATAFQPQGTSAVKMISIHAEVEVDVAESDVAKLKVGQSATVVLDAFGDERTFAGTLVWISPGETTVQDLVYYKARVALIEPGSDIRPGMTATANIITLEKESALLVPQRAVREADGKRTVRIQKADLTIEEREVVTGQRADDGMVEVTSGLFDGDVVITSRVR